MDLWIRKHATAPFTYTYKVAVFFILYNPPPPDTYTVHTQEYKRVPCVDTKEYYKICSMNLNNMILLYSHFMVSEIAPCRPYDFTLLKFYWFRQYSCSSKITTSSVYKCSLCQPCGGHYYIDSNFRGIFFSVVDTDGFRSGFHWNNPCSYKRSCRHGPSTRHHSDRGRWHTRLPLPKILIYHTLICSNKGSGSGVRQCLESITVHRRKVQLHTYELYMQ